MPRRLEQSYVAYTIYSNNHVCIVKLFTKTGIPEDKLTFQTLNLMKKKVVQGQARCAQVK